MKKIALVLLLVGGLGVMSVGMVQADPIKVGDPLVSFELAFNRTRFRTVGASTHDSPIGPSSLDLYAARLPRLKSPIPTLAGDMFRPV